MIVHERKVFSSQFCLNSSFFLSKRLRFFRKRDDNNKQKKNRIMASRVLSRISRGDGLALGHRLMLAAAARQGRVQCLSDGFHSLRESAPSRSPKLLQGSVLGNITIQRFAFSSSASPQPSEKAANQFPDEQDAVGEHDKVSQDTEAEADLSIDDLVKLVAEKEELLKLKHKEIEKMQDKVLRSYADMENVIDRTKREAENSKKFAVQNFAKSLLDVADNLGRASSVVKESFKKIDSSKDSVGAVPLLKTLLEGVDMTDKQLTEVFRKFGVEKFDPTNEHFDPHRHHAVFQIPDASKPPGTVAAILKPGYMLYDRVIRPAEVGVTEALNGEADQSS